MSQDLLSQNSWRQQMKSHSGGRPETLIAICDAFLDEVPMLVQRVRAAVSEGDAAALRTAAHTLKTCLAYVAVEDDLRPAADIEANSADPDSISSTQLDQIELISVRWLQCVKTLREETAAAVPPESSNS